MNFRKNGARVRSHSIVDIFLLAKNNIKLELIVIVFYIAILLVMNGIDDLPYITRTFVIFLSPERIANFISFFGIIIGIYVTVWVVLATSVSKFNKELLKEKIDKKLFFVIIIGLIESSLVILFCIFAHPNLVFYTEILMLFIALSLISFCKFICTLMMITKLNIRYIVKELDENEKEKLEQKLKLDDIYNNTKNKIT